MNGFLLKFGFFHFSKEELIVIVQELFWAEAVYEVTNPDNRLLNAAKCCPRNCFLTIFFGENYASELNFRNVRQVLSSIFWKN